MTSTNAQLPKQMKAQLLESYNQPYVYKDIPLPEISSPDDLIIKVDAAGYCHTDAVLAAGQMPNPPKLPHIGSHEFAGTVIALADSPSEAARACPVGTRVGAPGRGFHVCRTCFECESAENDYPGYSNFCGKALSNGITKDGGFSQYAVVDARQVALLPDDMDAVTAAPLMCAGVTIYRAIKRCGLKSGQRVAIIGAGGGLGHLGIQFAAAMGLRVTAVDAADGPLEIARSLQTGATVIDARATTVDDAVAAIGKEDGIDDRANMGVDASIILPDGQAGFDYGFKLLRNHGLCVVVSFAEAGFHVSARDLVYRDIQVVGTLLGTRADLQEVVALASKSKIRIINKTYGLAKLNDLVDEYHRGGGGKLIVDMSL